MLLYANNCTELFTSGFLTWNICRGKYANQSSSITFMDHFAALLEYGKQYGHCNVPKKDWYTCIIPISEYNVTEEKQYYAPLGSWLYINKLKFLKLKTTSLEANLIKNTASATTSRNKNATYNDNINSITNTTNASNANTNIDYNLPTVTTTGRTASSRKPSLDLEQKLEQMEHNISFSQQSQDYDDNNSNEVVIRDTNNISDTNTNTNNNATTYTTNNTLEIDGMSISDIINSRGNSKGAGVSDKLRLILFQQLINQGNYNGSSNVNTLFYTLHLYLLTLYTNIIIYIYFIIN